jgi:hypothetical protein
VVQDEVADCDNADGREEVLSFHSSLLVKSLLLLVHTIKEQPANHPNCCGPCKKITLVITNC